ncbi:hypothetical protein MTR_4g016455 [Medicago truncatula]|uniref:Uncharacterized protein n=1 Tax=Medicago truncatula TaxID=3880 RepID=A0A072USR2_MEDTR|nr:hypothetical protein MTR_4g016455 [Medicago truncatula]
MRFPVDRKPERAVQAKIRDKKNIYEKLAEIVRNSGKNERLDEPKTRKGGSCKNEIETKGKLAKSKTRKGGLGKNEHPAGLTTRKGSSGKNGALKRIYFPGGLKTRKGDPGKNGMQKMNE